MGARRIAIFSALVAFAALSETASSFSCHQPNNNMATHTRRAAPTTVAAHTRTQLLEEKLGSFSNPLSGKKRRTSRNTSVSMESEGDSEWYVPPPPPKKTPPPVRLPRGVVPKTTEIQNNPELTEFLQEDDRLCLVKFHATWCKSCQRFGMHFDKLAAQKADWVDARTGDLIKKNQIRIATVEWTKSQALCESLGVTKLPTTFFYAKGRKLTEMAVGAGKFSKVRDAVEQHLSYTPEEMDFAATMEAGAALIQSNVLDPSAAADAPETKRTTASSSADPLAELKAALETSASGAKPAPRRKWWLERKGRKGDKQKQAS